MSTHAPTHLMTADDLLRLPRGAHRYELVKGALHTMSPAGGEHGRIALTIGQLLANHVRPHNLGRVYAAETGFLIERTPDTVKAPDTAFIAADRVQTWPAYIPIPPDLAVEVVSPNDTYAEVMDKVRVWLAFDARLVYTVDMTGQWVAVYRADGSHTVLLSDEILDSGDIIPGLRILVADIFS